MSDGAPGDAAEQPAETGRSGTAEERARIAPDQIIEVVRSGGFAGIERRGSIRLAKLEASVAAALRAQFDDVPSGRAPGAGTSGVDRFAYELSWATGGHRRVVHVAEHDLPNALRQVIDASLRPGRS